MKTFKILRNKKDFIIAISSSLFMLILYPILQTLATGGLKNLDLWFAIIPKINLLMVIIFSILFGLLLTLQIHNFNLKTCSLKSKSISASSGSIGAFLGILVPACPACISIATLILPAAVGIQFVQVIVKFNTIILLASIILMILGILILGGFKNETPRPKGRGIK